MDDVLLNKAASIERCLKRINEDYIGYEDELESNYTRQDAIILNLQRACETSIDAAMHIVRKRRLGIPQQSKEAFSLMEAADLISTDMCMRMRAMVGFRNIAVHEYRELNIAIVRKILKYRIVDFSDFSALLIAISTSGERHK